MRKCNCILRHINLAYDPDALVHILTNQLTINTLNSIFAQFMRGKRNSET